MARALEIEGLNYDDSLNDCLRLLFQQRTNELYTHYAKIFSERNIEVLHNTRVAARRLQALFKIFRKFFPQKKYKEVYLVLRQFIRLLGPVRELDVLTAMLGKYISKFNIGEVKALMLLFANLNYETLEKRAELFKHPEILNFADKQNLFMKFYEKQFNKPPKDNIYNIYPLKSFKENATNIFPEMIERVLSYKTNVIGHPRNKYKLHRMRIKAKPLRYIMEIYLNAFNEDFKTYYEEIKKFVERTGYIHDTDVLNMKLKKFLKEIIFYNKSQKSKRDSISTKPIREYLSELNIKRANEFEQVCIQINSWESGGIKEKIITSVSQ